MIMIIIEEKQIEKTVTMSMAIPVFKKAYEDCINGHIYTGDRIVMPVRGEENCAQWLVACCTNVPIFGSKFASVFPENVSRGMPSVLSQISLYSAVTGELLALLDANYLTAIKTGGSAAIATDLMANKDADKLGIIGTGTQAFTQVLGVQEVRNLSELHVYDKHEERVFEFVEKIKGIQNHPYKIIVESSADECVAASQIVCTCTPSLTPVFNGNVINPGTHINAIGSFTPFMQEIDETAVMRSDKVITEHVEGLWAAAGDILIPFNKGLFGKDKVDGSVGELLTGKILGREDRDQITLYESVGSCVLDIGLT